MGLGGAAPTNAQHPTAVQALTRKTPLGGDVDLAAVGASPRLTGFSGADLAALVREACVCALKESMAAAMSAGGAAATAGTPQVSHSWDWAQKLAACWVQALLCDRRHARFRACIHKSAPFPISPWPLAPLPAGHRAPL